MEEPTIQDLIDQLYVLINDPAQSTPNRQCYQGQVQWLEGCRNWLIEKAEFDAAHSESR